jgi:hypothetical protein
VIKLNYFKTRFTVFKIRLKYIHTNMNGVFAFLDFFKGIVSKLLREVSKLKNRVTEDTKALLIVIAFIGFIAFSNYREKEKETSDSK